MKLYAVCNECKSEISFWTWNVNRIDFKKSKNEWIPLLCKNCNREEKYHIDTISAKESKVALIVGLILLLVGTPLLFIFLWDYLFEFNNVYTIFGLVTPLIIPGLIYRVISKNDLQRVRNFNRS